MNGLLIRGLSALLLTVLGACSGNHAQSVGALGKDSNLLPPSQRAAPAGEKVLWRVHIPARGLRPDMAVTKAGLFLTVGSELLVLDRESGKRTGTFRNPSQESLSVATAVDDNLAVVTDSRAVHAVDGLGHEVWRYDFGEPALKWETVENQPCVISSGGTILAAGFDGYVHAIDRAGSGLWRVHVGAYGTGKPALLIAANADLLLLDTRMIPGGPPNLVGINLRDSKHGIRFSLNLGIDVSGLVAGGRSGIVATSYTETKSRRGASKLVSLDEHGRQRWIVERGRHEVVRGVFPGGDLVTLSQDAAGSSPSTSLEMWGSDGQRKHSRDLEMVVTAVLLGKDDALYAVGCQGRSAVLEAYRGDLSAVQTLNLSADCPAAATLDDHGRLFLLGGTAREVDGVSSVEMLTMQTPSPAAADSWASPRAHATGSGSFRLDGDDPGGG